MTAEIPDPHDLAMELRVNGQVRQTSHSGRMSVTIPEIVAHYSALGYSAGDVLSTGTVSGVAGFSPDAASLYLRPGDVMEAEIEKIGVLRNPVISWQEGHEEPAAARAVVVGGSRSTRYSMRRVVHDLRRGLPDADERLGAVARTSPELFDRDRWRLPFRSFLIRSADRTILVDTAVGPAGGDFYPTPRGGSPASSSGSAPGGHSPPHARPRRPRRLELGVSGRGVRRAPRASPSRRSGDGRCRGDRGEARPSSPGVVAFETPGHLRAT